MLQSDYKGTLHFLHLHFAVGKSTFTEIFMTSSSHPAAPLLRVLQDCILPALEYSLHSRFVIARTQRRQLLLPPDMRAVPLKLRGRRVAVRSPRDFQRAVLLTARWPQDGMHEYRIPKLVIVVEGKAGLRCGDYVLQCPAGTVALIPPGVPHTNASVSHLETLPPDIRRCSILGLTPIMSGLACRMCHAIGEEHLSRMPGEKVFLHRPQVLQLFYMLAEEANRNTAKTDNALVFESLLISLLRTVLRDIQEEDFLLQDVPPHEEDERSLVSDPLERAMQYLNTHYANPLKLDDVARQFFMSRAQFTRKFRERTGQSFLEFLNAKRLQQARQLLVETDWSAVMIAQYVGYGASAYFHRIFLRETGMSPMQFREQARSSTEKREWEKVSD